MEHFARTRPRAFCADVRMRAHGQSGDAFQQSGHSLKENVCLYVAMCPRRVGMCADTSRGRICARRGQTGRIY